MDAACLFCGMASGSVPATFVHEDEIVFVLRDINPQAPIHLLVIPKRHFPDLTAVAAEDPTLLQCLFVTAVKVARDNGLVSGGYRVVVNTGSDGGQTVPHVHVHVLGGRHMAWPPG